MRALSFSRHLGILALAAAACACAGGSGGGTPGPGIDAALLKLTASAGTLAPPFSPDTTSYALSVPEGTATITVVPTARDPKVHGITVVQDALAAVPVASGTASQALAVPAAGVQSAIAVVVTAEDGSTTRKYTLAMSSAAPAPDLCGASDPVAVVDTSPGFPSEPTIPSPCAVLEAAVAVDATTGLPTVDPAVPPADTVRLQAAIDGCSAGSVKLQRSSTDSTLVAFVSGPLKLKSNVTLWVDQGVTLFASRNPRDFDKTAGTATCATAGSSSGCQAFLSAASTIGAGIMGQGTIDGLGGEPMVGGYNGDASASWWDFASAQSGSFSNPRLVDVTRSQGFTLYRITLHNSPKFHVGLESDPFLVWGVTILTPSRKTNSVGRTLTAHGATNTDGIDPYNAGNGYIVYSTISTGDDQIALKCGDPHLDDRSDTGASCRGITIAHDHLGTGHGMSIGSETNAGKTDGTGVGVDGLHVYDLSIDGLLPNGNAGNVNLNGIRVKSDRSRGGIVRNVVYEDVCMRGLANPILLNPSYDPGASGNAVPTFESVTVRNVRHVSCSGAGVPAPVVTLYGLDSSHRTGVALDGVLVEGISPAAVHALNADVVLGPGPVDFTPSGPGVTVTNGITGAGTANACAGKFVALPSPR